MGIWFRLVNLTGLYGGLVSMDNLRKKDLREVAQRAMGFSDDLTRIIDKNCSLCVKIEGKRLDVYRKGNKTWLLLY